MTNNTEGDMKDMHEAPATDIKRSPERIRFLTDLMDDAMLGVTYWAEWGSIPGENAYMVTELEGASDNPVQRIVTIDTLAKGLRMAADGSADFSNPGYTSEPTRTRMAKLNRSNGADADYDSWDGDCLIQAALFGQIIYG